MWNEHLRIVIHTDPKMTDQQKRWMGYTLKITLKALLDNVEDLEKREKYLSGFLDVMRQRLRSEDSVFIVLDTMLEVPFELCSRADVEKPALEGPAGPLLRPHAPVRFARPGPRYRRQTGRCLFG